MEIRYETGFARGQDNTKAVFRLRYVEPIDIRVGREPVTRHRIGAPPYGVPSTPGFCLRKRSLTYPQHPPSRVTPVG